MVPFAGLLAALDRIPDPRRRQGRRYGLAHLLLFSVLAVLAGATSYRRIRLFIGVHRERLNATFGARFRRAPAVNTLRALLHALDPAELEAAFRRHAEQLDVVPASPGRRVVALDGKTLRGSFDHLDDQAAAQVLSAFASEAALILAHQEIAGGDEVAAAQALIERLGLSGVLFTADALHCQKNLGRQSWLAKELFEPAEVGSGIAAEPRPQHAGVPTALEAGAHLAPARPIGAGQIAGVPAAQPGGQTGEQPHRAAQHGRRAVGLAAGRPPLVTAVRAEQPFEVVVGARQVGHGIAVEQAGAVAAGHLQEVVDGAGERAGLGAVAADGGDEPGEAAGDRGRVEARHVVQDPGRAVHPGVGAADVRPEVAGAVQGVRDQPAQAPQEPRHPPFSATRSRLATTASSRSASLRPEAAKGGRPSSVIALRTAAQ
jgi:DDE_Tnp_1-associated